MTEGDTAVLPISAKHNGTLTLSPLRRVIICAGTGCMANGSVANDVLAFGALDLDMIGIGPYIPHPATPLGSGRLRPFIAETEQVPNTEEMVLKAVALARIASPTANIPSTMALATIDKENGRRLGLMIGANVVMPNLTPEKYRRLYEIYPAKACVDEDAVTCRDCLRAQLRSIGRCVGVGPGGRERAWTPGRKVIAGGTTANIVSRIPDAKSRSICISRSIPKFHLRRRWKDST